MFNCMLCSWVQVVCVQLNAQHCVRELDCSPDFFYYCCTVHQTCIAYIV